MKKFTKATSDSDLISAFKSGDNTAFECIIEKYTKPLSATIFNTVKDTLLTEDIVQESFFKLLLSIQNGSYSHSNQTLNWLNRVGSNLCIDYLRKLKRRPTVSLSTQPGESKWTLADILQDPESFQETSIDNNSYAEDFSIDPRINLHELIDLLPVEQKEVVLLRFYRMFSFIEIAEYTESPVNTCLGRMRYALINLRKILHEKQSLLQQ